MTSVTLAGGPLSGSTVSVDDPWPRTCLVLESGASVVSYQVDNPYDPTGPYTAAYVAPEDFTGEDDFYAGLTGAQGPPGIAGPQGDQGDQGDPGEPLNPTGDYSNLVVYSELDMVTDGDGSSFVSIQDANIAQPLPTGPGYTSTAFWQLVAAIGPQGYVGPQGDIGLQGTPGSPLPPRQTATKTTASLAADAGESGTIALAKGFRVLHIGTDRAAWVRLYTTPTKRTADVARVITSDPSGDHGVILEVITGGALLALDLCDPTPSGFSGETTPSANIAYRIVNKSGATSPVTVTFIYQEQES